ncbi:MAG: FkbM family methyltransferase [Bacteroidetes bacterium]|nr:FkbM family methyltransferase [Bacteroidota bacterium]
MKSILRSLESRFYKWTEPALGLPIHVELPVERLGSKYGGWIVPNIPFSADAVCYLIGAGEDISFDLALANRSDCMVHIFDPTPRAIAHVTNVQADLRLGKQSQCATCLEGVYPPYPAHLAEKMRLHPIGIWNADTTLRFYAPGNESFVSHSIVNLQQTEQYIEVPVERLITVMKRLGHEHIDLLKMDIEGAEYQVIESIISDQVSIDVLCIEFDESAAHHFDRHYMRRIRKALTDLMEFGYILVRKEKGCHNYTLLHQRKL